MSLRKEFIVKQRIGWDEEGGGRLVSLVDAGVEGVGSTWMCIVALGQNDWRFPGTRVEMMDGGSLSFKPKVSLAQRALRLEIPKRIFIDLVESVWVASR